MTKGIHLINNMGVKSLQAGDYNTYYALAEIIDNSIAAKAKNIHVMGVQERTRRGGRTFGCLNEVIVYDDGKGMTKDVVALCLQLGGGTNIGAKKGLSKFGMGLPQASGSQCMRTEVYTWQKKGEIYHTYLDFDELEKKDPPVLPTPKLTKALPRYLMTMLKKVTSECDAPFSEKHGTIICWKRANRLNHRTYKAFFRNIEFFIGRVYRYFLHAGKCSITVSGFEKMDRTYTAIAGKSFKKLRVNDPMFLLENNIVGDFDAIHANKATNEEYGKEIKTIHTDKQNYDIRIKFSLVKQEILKHLGTNNPGGTRLGKDLYGKNMGISLLRAGRELKLSDFGFIGDRSDPTHRWWSVEVEFEPELDLLFGVTFDKQEARLFRKIEKDEYQEDLDEGDDESLKLMYAISKKIVGNIKEMHKKHSSYTKGNRTPPMGKCAKCGSLAVEDNKCKECGHVLGKCAKHTDQILGKDGKCPVCILDGAKPVDEEVCTRHNVPLVDGRCKLCEKENKGKDVLSLKDEKRLRRYLEDNFSNYKGKQNLLDGAIEYLKTCGRNHVMVYTEGDRNSFVTYSSYGQLTIISVNMNHLFYENFMQEIIEDDGRDIKELVPIHFLIGAMVNSEQQDYENQDVLEDFRGTFSLNLKKLMKNFSLK